MSEKKRGYVYNIAIFLIFLIVMLPISGANAWAATINPPVVSTGAGDVPGFRAMDDVTRVKVSVTHPEDPTLDQGQVRVLEDPTRYFDCNITDPGTITSICEMEYPQTSLPDNIDTIPFTVQVFSDANEPISSPAQGRVMIDNEAPKIDALRYTPAEGGLVYAEYRISDTACDSPECANLCSGLFAISFNVGDQQVGRMDDLEPECSLTGKVNLSGIVTPGEVATKHICANVIDRMGQAGEKCGDVDIDAKPPVITSAILTDGMNPIKYTNGQPVGNVRIQINISEDHQLVNPRNLMQTSPIIFVNASDITEQASQKASFGNVMIPCAPTGEGKYTCVSSGLMLVMTQARTVNFRIEAADEFGNKVNETRAMTLTFDNVAPQANKIYTDFVDDRETYWMNETPNNIHVDITETGSGFENKQVLLDVSGLGTQPGLMGGVSTAIPNRCEPGWKCTWNNVQSNIASGSTWVARVLPESRDDAGNKMQAFSAMIRTDTDAPEIVAINITSIGEEGESVEIASGDSLMIHAYVEDYTPVEARANFSKIMAEQGQEAVPGTCGPATPENETASNYTLQIRQDTSKRLWDCVWETGAIVNVPYDIEEVWTNTTIFFTAEDIFKHRTVEEHDITILGRENATADYWTVETTQSSPKRGLDRFAWPISQPMSFQHIKVTQRWGTARMISAELQSNSCFGDNDYVLYQESGDAGVTLQGFDTDISDGIDDVVVIEMNPANVPPMEKVDPVTNDSSYLIALEVTCPMRIRSVVGEARISTEEIENVTFTIPVRGNPMGDVMPNVKEEIKKWEDFAGNGYWKIVSIPTMIFKYAKIVCQIMQVLQQLISLFKAITGPLEAACLVSPSTCSGARVANDNTGQLQKVTDGLFGKFTMVCALVINCRATSAQAVGAKKTGTKEKPKYECPKDSGWCKFFKGWAGLNEYFVDAFSGAWITDTDLAETPRFAPVKGKTGALQGAQISAGYDSMSKDTKFWDKSTLRGSFDPQKSLISSVLTVCLPGIFSGIEKYRQAVCARLMCYKVNIAVGSMQMHQCDEIFRFTVCRYVFGEIWNVLPFVQYVTHLNTIFRDVAKNPFLLAGYAIDTICTQFCSAKATPGGCSICTGIKYANVAAQFVGSIVGIVQQFKNPKEGDICKEALKKEPKYSNLPGFPKEKDPAEQAKEITNDNAPTESEATGGEATTTTPAAA